MILLNMNVLIGYTRVDIRFNRFGLFFKSNENRVWLRKENSFELTYEWVDNSGELAAKARTVHVFVDKKRWVKIPIYDEIVKGLESHQRDVNL